MTPKEKAEELTNKMFYHYGDDFYFSYETAKEYALIAVNEQIDNAEICLGRFRTKNDMIEVRDYWRQVRNEIEKL